MNILDPFGFWPSDPNGYLRHFVVGLALAVVLYRTRTFLAFSAVLAIAIGKEAVDDLILNKFAQIADIVATIAPLIVWRIYIFITTKQ